MNEASCSTKPRAGHGAESARADGGTAERSSWVGSLTDWFRSLRRGRNGDELLRHALEELIEERERNGDGVEEAIDPHERILLSNVLRLRDVVVYDVMVPRADIVAVEETVSLQELVRLMAREAHSRLPIYRNSLDDVVGMVHIKDVLASIEGEQPFKLSAIMRKPLFVAPSMPVLDLLLDMRLKRTHMALVVDEFGGIDGLVTIEDIVEEIVGEIEDEHDEAEGPMLVQRPDGSFDVDARIPIEELEAQVGPFLTPEEREEDIDTLSGLVFSLAGRVPARGELIAHPSGFEFQVTEADPRRIKRLRVRRPAARRPAVEARADA